MGVFVLQLHWFLPSHGDGRDVAKAAGGTLVHRREPDLDYLTQVAIAADRFGFAGILTPAGIFCEDAWVVASALAGVTSRLKFMVALRPGLVSPTLAAAMAATFQRISGDRLLLNVVTGGDADEMRRYGDWLGHDERYERTDEFLTVLRQALSGNPYDFAGAHVRVAGAMVTRPPRVRPPLFLGGSSAAAHRVAAKQVDVYLAWGEHPDSLRTLVEQVRAQAAGLGRELAFGSRYHVIARPSSEQAWAEANRLVAGIPAARIAQAQERFARSESEGQRRMAAMHGGRTDRLEIYPNIWAGYALVRPGAGAVLVGSFEEVAERIGQLHALGLDHLILSGQPHLEEAFWFGEGVLPLLRERGVLDEPLASAAGIPA